MRVFGCNVRGVGNDQVESLSAQPLEPAGLQKLHVDRVPRGVFSGNRECRRRNVYRGYAGSGALMRNGDCYAAAASAQIQHIGTSGRHSCKGSVYQRLRVRAWNQDIRRDAKFQAVELPFAYDIRDWFARSAPIDKLTEGRNR